MRTMEPLAENVHIAADGSAIEIVDQTKLPGEYVLKRVRTAEEMYDAIQRLEVRGAPAIGIFAAYCMYALAEQLTADNHGISAQQPPDSGEPGVGARPDDADRPGKGKSDYGGTRGRCGRQPARGGTCASTDRGCAW